MNFKHTVLLILLIACTGVAQAQVSFKAKVSKEKLGINERLRVDFVMNKDGDNFSPPNFQGFRVVMGPSQSISQSWNNGKRSFSKSYSYTLSPVSKGKFTIRQATVVIDGATYKTTPIQVEVTSAVSKPNADTTAADVADKNLHLIAEVSKANPYLNEAISVVYKLYIGQYVSVTNYKAIDNPKYNNFWSQDIAIGRLKAERGTYQGKPYQFVVLKRVVLYPQKTGKLELEPLTLDVSVEVPTNKRDFFGRRLQVQTNKTVAAGRRVINVKELPENGKPENFSGAVGQFNFKVTTSKTELNATESLQAKVEVSGKGNLKLLNIPKLNLPSSLEVYEPEFEEKVATYFSGMQGKVTNNYTVVPSYRGKYPIPSVAFSYFDPKTRSYKTLYSEEKLVNVIEGPSSAIVPTANNNASGTVKQNVNTNNSQFRFLKQESNLVPTTTTAFFASQLFYLLMFLPLLLIPIAIFIGKKRAVMANDVQGNKIRRSSRLAKKYLSTAKKALQQEAAFYIALEKALHNYLKGKLQIETTDFSKEKIAELLAEKGLEESSISKFIALLNSCELARYTPISSTAMQADYDKAVDAISLLDKQL